MNIQNLQSSVGASAPGRIGGRLDIRSDAPAPAHPATRPVRSSEPQASTALQGADLIGVLDSQERQALTAAFAPETAPAYSGRGRSAPGPSVLGSRLDLSA